MVIVPSCRMVLFTPGSKPPGWLCVVYPLYCRSNFDVVRVYPSLLFQFRRGKGLLALTPHVVVQILMRQGILTWQGVSLIVVLLFQFRCGEGVPLVQI